MKHKIGRQDQIILQCMALFGLSWFLIFYYLPYYGLTIAFKDFSFRQGISGSAWAGLRYFRELITDPDIKGIIMNTVSISVMKVLINFPVTILFAVLLNELTSTRFKRVVQTVSYFPHFISWVIVSLILTYWLSPEFGMINKILLQLNVIARPLTPLTNADAFYWLAVLSEMWKEIGWSSIIFLAAIAGIDPQQYEAALVDGASRIQRILHITLPNITGTIVLMFLMNCGSLFTGTGATFEQSVFLFNPLNISKAMVLGHYTMRIGVSIGRFSYATAVGLLNGVVSVTLLLTCNALCKRFLGRSLYDRGE